MESHETLGNVEEMKATLKEILNVLQDIQKVFKSVTYNPPVITGTAFGDEQFMQALNLSQKPSAETPPLQEPEDEVV